LFIVDGVGIYCDYPAVYIQMKVAALPCLPISKYGTPLRVKGKFLKIIFNNVGQLKWMIFVA